MAHVANAVASGNSGFLTRETDPEYREQSKTRLTSHALADFRKCPLLYRKKKDGLIPDEDRPSFALGRAAHVLILEHADPFNRLYVISDGPINDRTGKAFGKDTIAYREWKDALKGKEPISWADYELVSDMADGVCAHPVAVSLLEQGQAEGVVRAEYCGVPCQSRLDWFDPQRGIVDLKSCDDLTWFEADARRFGYAHQVAFYQAMIERATGETVPVHMVAVEKREPFRCGVWLVQEQALRLARLDNESAIGRLKQCEKTGVWPTGYEERRVFDFL
jgi:hypothetical protein